MWKGQSVPCLKASLAQILKRLRPHKFIIVQDQFEMLSEKIAVIPDPEL